MVTELQLTMVSIPQKHDKKELVTMTQLWLLFRAMFILVRPRG